MALNSTFLVSNIHCPSCVSYVQDLLQPVPGVQSIQVSLIDHTIKVSHSQSNSHTLIAKHLLDAAFEVSHVTTIDSAGRLVQEYNINDVSTSHSLLSLFRSRQKSKTRQRHIDNCDACRRETQIQSVWTNTQPRPMAPKQLRNSGQNLPQRKDAAPMWLNDPQKSRVIQTNNILNSEKDTEFTATISIGGMTCSSCTSTITKELEGLDFVEHVDVSLLAGNARVLFRGPVSNAEKITEAVIDIGYDATLDKLVEDRANLPRENDTFKSVLSIEGMTCGSCIGSISDGLQQLPFVKSVEIDLVGNAGNVVYEGVQNLDTIIHKVSDLGYSAVEVSTERTATLGTDIKRERTIRIQIDGMFCDHCPAKVSEVLRPDAEEFAGHIFSVSQWPTLKNPVMTVTYIPSVPDLTARTFIQAIEAGHDAFKARIQHPPSLEERSSRIRKEERNALLWRLVFTAVAAIPSFIIGVVFMSLVPESNHTKTWFREPILHGSGMRMDWALFFITTPIMFFGADIFHRRAFKEIVVMWRPRSAVPIFRRFYRFGSMNLLISAGTCVAYFSSLAVLIMDATTPPMQSHEGQSSSSYFDTVTFLTLFILIGRYLEAYSKAKTGDAVSMLSKLRPSEARLIQQVMGNRVIKTVPVDQLEIGDIVQVSHGASPPTDGTIAQEGVFLFDESSLTGESKPVKKTLGDMIYTGSVNASEPVELRVTEVDGTSMLDQIVNVVREGQGKRAPIERIADLITGYFVPVITLLALLTWLIWLALGLSGRLPETWLGMARGGWAFWSLQFAIAVFVVACPCGIGLAAPTALFVGGGLAAKQGILVQGGGEAFQDASKLEVIVFDKTGTLTEGQMRVAHYELLDQDLLPEKLVLGMSQTLEEYSTHPIAKAVAAYCAQHVSEAHWNSSNIKEIPGQGMTGTFIEQGGVASYEVAIGNERLLQSLCAPSRLRTQSEKASMPVKADGAMMATHEDYFLGSLLKRHQSLGQSVAILAVRRTETQSGDMPSGKDFTPVALFGIADPVRKEAPEVLHKLRDRGLEVHMCTGDNHTTALAIAAQLGIHARHVRANVLPEGKAKYVKELQGLPVSDETATISRRRVVAFVGDGTNDTPALAAADVSVALSTGSDVAMTTASFILLNSDLQTIVTLVQLAKRVFLRVKLNFAWAAVYNTCLIPVAAGVFYYIGANDNHGGWRLGPVWASAAMALSSVSVVLSSLALRLPEMKLWKKSS